KSRERSAGLGAPGVRSAETAPRSQTLAFGTKSRECGALSGRLGYEARRARRAPATLLATPRRCSTHRDATRPSADASRRCLIDDGRLRRRAFRPPALVQRDEQA